MTTVAREPTTDFGFDLSAIAFWQERTLDVSSVINGAKRMPFALA